MKALVMEAGEGREGANALNGWQKGRTVGRIIVENDTN
jgi:hypothetical protein